ncbi:MAG: DoxX family membrane protein [Chloroflexota bacterium]|nr:DoxX family membrane protein [Chloroflexota bacterium]
MHPYVTLGARALVGGTFIFAGAAKLPYPETLIWEINQYHILPPALATAYGYVLPPLEIALGVFLVAGLFLRSSGFLTGLLALSFTIAKVYALARGLDVKICGCLGPAIPLLAAQSLVIDFVLIALALQIVLHRGEFLSLGGWLQRRARAGKGETGRKDG